MVRITASKEARGSETRAAAAYGWDAGQANAAAVDARPLLTSTHESGATSMWSITRRQCDGWLEERSTASVTPPGRDVAPA